MNADTRTWAKGLFAAIIGAAANAVAAIVSDPSYFNVSTANGWKHIGNVAGIAALVAGAMYLKQSPLPTSTTTITTTLTKEISKGE